ncbi:MAG: hydrogenase iron-sulfur subunit [Chloroflexi bacterium]|nr:hydrogenase iron-sulfur subunit [Chloroflexota bacterium]
MSHKSPETFAEQVRAIPGGEHLELCYSCGTCVSKCLIQQKVEPEYNPRRLLRLVMMHLREEAFRSPTTWLCSACDLCYPACPQQIHISGVIGAIKQLAVEAGYTSPLETVSVDESLCSGCSICVMACPYEAPHLVEKEIEGEMDCLAEVDANKCMGCGICVAACPIGAISRKGVSNQEIVKQIKVRRQKKGVPRLVAFVCDWCLRADADVSLLESYPDNVRVIHIPCSGRIDPQMTLLALRSGINGVLVCGCAPGECHYQRGTYVSACKMGLLGRVLDQMNVGDGRVRFVQIGTQDRGRIRTEVDAMLEHLVAQKEAR